MGVYCNNDVFWLQPTKCKLIKLYFNEQECKVRPQTVNVNSKDTVFLSFSIKTSKWSGSCNNINNPYAKLCIPDVVENLNVKVFNLISRTNETRLTEWHETCKCKCRLDDSDFNNKQRWNDAKCRRKYKELIDKVACDKWLIWNLINCECERDKSCDVGEYLQCLKSVQILSYFWSVFSCIRAGYGDLPSVRLWKL